MGLELPVSSKADQLFALDKKLRSFVADNMGGDLSEAQLLDLDDMINEATNLVAGFSGFDPGEEVRACLESVQGAFDTISTMSREAEAVVEGKYFEPAYPDEEMVQIGVDAPEPA